MNGFWRLFLVLSFSLVPAIGYAADNSPAQTMPAAGQEAVSVGDNIPHDLKTVDQDGQERRFETVTGENGAVLVFVRSADWCPFCQAQLLDLQQKAEEIEKLGYNIVTISYDAPEKLSAFAIKYDFKHTMLSDTGSEIIKAFGILNEEVDPNSFYYGIPNPTIFVVSRGGVVQGRLAEEGYKNRPPVQDVVAIIQGQ